MRLLLAVVIGCGFCTLVNAQARDELSSQVTESGTKLEGKRGAKKADLPNPIQRVIELIQELKEKMISDAKAEELVYNKMACWCETTTKNKAEEVKTCQGSLADLSTDINNNKGNIATLAADIHELMTDIEANEAKQYEETTKRERQNADFMQNKAELTNAMTALDKAVQMLGGVDHLALLQGKAKLSMSQMTTLKAVKPAVIKAMDRLPTQNNIPAKHLSVLARLGEQFGTTYSPFEPTVTQILRDLLESFRATSKTEAENEVALQSSYEEIMETKSAELKAKKSLMAEKEGLKAQEESELTANQEVWQQTANQLKSANEVFGLAKEACSKKADEWEERCRLRDEELAGIQKGLDILTDDENRALIGKASGDGPGNLDFVQTGMMNEKLDEPYKLAYLALRKAARNSHNFKIGQIAAKVFQHAKDKVTKGKHTHKSKGKQPEDELAEKPEWMQTVIGSIREIQQDLRDAQKKDTVTLDNCKEEIHQLNLIIDNQTHTIKRHNWKIDKLVGKIEDTQAKIDEAAENVESILAMQAKLLKEREDEHVEYESEKSDDEAAIKVMASAIAAMSAFYEKNDIKLGKLDELDGKFLQVPNDKNDDNIFLQESSMSHTFLGLKGKEPVFKKTDKEVIDGIGSHSFSAPSKRGQQSKGIISLMTLIKEDLELDIEKSIQIENDSEAEYQEIKTQTDNEKKDLKNKIDDLKDERTTLEGKKETEETFKAEEETRLHNSEEGMSVLMGAGDAGKDIDFPCEFMLNKYTERRHQRSAEMDGMIQAVAYLLQSGQK
jgi:hypothetical protein